LDTAAVIAVSCPLGQPINQADAIMEETKKCIECFGTFSIDFFAVKRRCDASITRRPRCKRCGQERRDSLCRYKRKARKTMEAHAKTFGISTTELRNDYGWDVEIISNDLENAYDRDCPYCREKYKGMGNGLRDMTIDIVDRNSGPYYRTNVKICCITCNVQKGVMQPESWERHLIYHKEWEENKAQRESMPRQQQLF
jgi:hypothetical protein